MAKCPECGTKLKTTSQLWGTKMNIYICPNDDCDVTNVKIERR